MNRLGVDSEPLTAPGDSQGVNFDTGKEVDGNGTGIDFPALFQYSAVLEQFPYFSDGGYNLPDPVPEDLLIPFGDFVEKYKLQNIIPVTFIFAHGAGNIMDRPTLEIIQLFGQPHVAALLGGYVRVKNGTAKLYSKAAEVLDSAVLYESTVVAISRPDVDDDDDREGKKAGVTVEVRSSSGDSTTINAKKLLITIPPTLENLKDFDLDDREVSLFSQWQYKAYYIAVLNNTGIPDGLSVVNTIPENPGQLPRVPFVWHLDDVGVPGYKTTKIVGDASFSEKDGQDLLFGDIQRMYEAGTFIDTGGPELVAWGSHTPTTMSVSTDAVRGGFYRDLYGLQGHHDTFYTGLSFCSDYSTLLWGFTDAVVRMIIA